MLRRDQLISEIRPADIFELIAQQAPEDTFLEFKQTVLHPAKPPEKLEDERDDLVADFVSFANAAGGHIIVGIKTDAQERAADPAFMSGDDARTIAQTLRDLAIGNIQPAIRQFEVLPFAMNPAGTDWVVIAAIPDSPDKPHMVARRDKTYFTIRTGNRKRPLSHAEIQSTFLNAPQQQVMSRFLLEIESVKTLVEEIRDRMEGRGAA